MIDLISESYSKLYGKEIPFFAELAYSGRFKGYSGVVRKRGDHIAFSVSKKWAGVDREIQIGHLQVLFNKILRTNNKTINIDLYNNFIKSLHLSVEKTKTDPALDASCERVLLLMELYDVEKPNLQWGSGTFRTLAHYRYEDDTITVSNLFVDAPQELLDYLMYHELLHKKFKFSSTGARSLHHSAEFKRWEKRFPESARLEKELSAWVRKKRKRNWMPW